MVVALTVTLVPLPSLASHEFDAHWRISARAMRFIAIRDNTRDDGAWSAAIQAAVVGWNDALSTAGVPILLQYKNPSNNVCDYRRAKITVCSKVGRPTWRAWAGLPNNKHDHIQRGEIGFNDYWHLPADDPQRQNLACHEIGHTLGLDHADDPTTSCVNSRSTLTAPGPHDIEALIAGNDHRH
jgi:predicted Zn-dependent protease